MESQNQQHQQGLDAPSVHRKRWGLRKRTKKQPKTQPEQLKAYTTIQLLKMSLKLIRLTFQSFWVKHKVLSRLVALVLITALLISIVLPMLRQGRTAPEYSLTSYEHLLDEPIALHAQKITRNVQNNSLDFNIGYQPGGEIAGDSTAPKITATFASEAGGNAVVVKDPINDVSVTVVPKFPLIGPMQDQNRVIYKVPGNDILKVYTTKVSGIKEDIIIQEMPDDDVLSFDYELKLDEGLEARIEQDGSVGVYGLDSPLLGNVSTGTEEDAKLLETARKNGEKTKLVFSIPAPFTIESGGKKNVTTWYELNGNMLTVYASGLRSALYPLSIDPTIYIESARKLMRGNNETNVDFDTTNELIQKSQTTGARIDYWSDSTELTTGVWDQAMANAGGFVYRAGGRVDPTMPYIANQQATTLATAGTTFTMALPTIRPAGDLYVALISRDGTGAITAPGGWTLIASSGEAAAYYKIGTDAGGGNEAASYNWTIGSAVEWTGTILRIKNFNSGSPISGTAGTTTGTGVPQYPTVTPSHDATLILRTAGINDDEPSDATWLPLGHTRIYANSSSTSATSVGMTAAYLDVPTLATVATGVSNFVSDGILNDSYGAISVAIRPATVTAGVQSSVEWAQFNSSTSTIDAPNAGNGVCSGWCTSSSYNLPAARVGMSMFAYNGYLYATGGTTDVTTAAAASATSTVWISKLGANGEPQLWHPTGGTPAYWFVSSNTLPSARSYHQIYAYNNRLYLVGGKDASSNSINSVHVADLLPTGDIGSWTTTNMQDLTTPSARHGHTIHIYNDIMYIVGGVTSTGGGASNTFRNTVFFSKLTSAGAMNAWQATSSFTTARSSFGGQMSTLAGGYLYLAGGCTALTSGYCSTIASDVQLASINADGSLAPWNSILTLSNQRVGATLMTWQGGLYRFGGCNRQNTSNGTCYAVHQSSQFGVINPAGDASTVRNSEPANTSPCSGGSPVSCDLPGAGDGAEQGGQMSSAIVINNGFIYVIGGCTSVAVNNVCETGGTSASSGNVMYASLDSTGQMTRPSTCTGGTYVTNSLWCVDSTRTINGTAGISTGSASVFNNTIYVAGGTNGADWQNDVWRVPLNSDGSLYGAWSFQDMTTDLGLTGTADDARGYMYTFTRANPGSAGTTPGNFYMIGGCRGGGGAADDGVGCGTYYTDVIKCNINVSGALSGCTTTGQMQVDADNINAGSQGIGLMAGTVYANRIYLIGGACTEVDVGGTGDDNYPCGINYSGNRKDTIYAAIDATNNIVDVDNGLSSGTWNFSTAQMDPVRRRAVAFGYNGYVYSLAGYSGTASLQDLLFSKIDVSTGDMGPWDSSGVVVTPRWDLRAIVSNGYVYAIGGCATGAAPTGCTAMQPEIQTFQLYNNDSGTPVSYSASANQFTTDRMGASSTILNGYLYVAGGCTTTAEVCTTALNSVQYTEIDSYGNLSNIWNAGGNLPDVRAWGQLESINTSTGGTLYYIGGQTSTATAEQLSVYFTTGISGGNPTWNGTQATNSLPGERTMHSASVWGNRIYVTGGLDVNAAPTTTVYVSPLLSSGGNIGSAWTTSTAFNVARSGHTTVAYANNLYILGGFDGTNYLNDVQFASIGYKAGTISQSGTSITGSGTAWTTAMIGSTFQYRDGETATILTVPSGTSMTVSVSKTVTAGTGYTILDGSVGSWSYTTSLPEPISQADGFAANGYIYLVGGRSSPGDCSSNTLQAPISANTTIATGNNATGIGEWYETNVKYSGERYGNSVSYKDGKLYLMGGACGVSPAPVSINTQVFGTNTTAHAVTMPATVDVGDLLIVLFTNDGNATVTTPAGWTLPTNGTALQGTNVRGSVFVKDAAGTEDGTTVDFVTSATEQASAQVIRVPAAKWEGNIASVEIPTAAVAVSGTSQDPPNANPAGWAIENTLWLSYVAGGTFTGVTTYPAMELGYHTTAGTGASGASASSSLRQLYVDSYNPSAYTVTPTNPGVTFTIAVRPPSTFTYTGANRVVQTSLYSQPQVAAYSRLIDTDTDVFPTSWLMNGLDNSIGARWQARYRSMHDISDGVGQQNPNEDCGTSATMPVMTTWGQETVYGDVALGDVATYMAADATVEGALDSGDNINCARYYYFYVSIDASQTFGYPEDVNRGPTISDLTLYFTSDPSKRLRHGKTFTGGEKQPLDTPCRQSIDAQCPLP